MHPSRLHAVQSQMKLKVGRQLVELEQMIAFEMKGDGALQKIRLDRDDLRIVKSGPQGNLFDAVGQIHPIADY